MNSSSDAARPPLIVLGVPGLDWPRLQRLAERGELPRLGRLLDEGAWAPVNVMRAPALSTWTTFATGVTPQVHGVLHPVERLADTLFVRGVDAASLRCPGFASIAAQAGLRVASVGWPATDGLVLDGGWSIGPGADLPPGTADADASLPPSAARPAEAAQAVRDLRLHAGDIPHADLAFFLAPLPAAAAARIAPAFAAALARASSRHGWATQALISLAPDVLMLHWPLLAETAPLLAACDAAGDPVRDRCLRFLDLVLAPYLGHRSGGARLLLLSDNGFVLAAGPGMARDRMLDPLATTEVFDLLATLAGLAPEGRRTCASASEFVADRTPLRSATLPPPARALRAEDFPDDFDAHPTAEDRARMTRAPAVDWAPWRSSARAVRRDTMLALAHCVADGGRADEALATLRPLLAETPDFLPARVLAARLAWSCGRVEEFASLAEAGRRLHGEGLFGDTARLMEALSRRDWPAFDGTLTRLMARAPWIVNLHAVAAQAQHARGNLAAAVDCLEAAVRHDPLDALAWGALSEALGRGGRHAEAVRAAGRAVSLQPGQRAPLMRLSQAQAAAGDAAGWAQTLLRATLARK